MTFDHGRIAGFWSWRARQKNVHVYFGGKGPRLDRQTALHRIVRGQCLQAWLDQTHSATVIDASVGPNGKGDALVSDRRGLGLSVVTADCVPVLLAGDHQIAAVHAGWRGLAQSILPAALERFKITAVGLVAWVGPAIGPCCYEVGKEVADQVIASSSADVVRQGLGKRPHLDLVAAARAQLERCGVKTVHVVGGCTQCDEARLWSYRREGSAAGRNLALIWQE